MASTGSINDPSTYRYTNPLARLNVDNESSNGALTGALIAGVPAAVVTALVTGGLFVGGVPLMAVLGVSSLAGFIGSYVGGQVSTVNTLLRDVQSDGMLNGDASFNAYSKEQSALSGYNLYA
ncbi:MAG: hypothetical protein SFZ03_02430 [Candidatus Melainabacteria bacterium]|nr:hypothetical protein [Candidatus Melainabacteria bacterium]